MNMKSPVLAPASPGTRSPLRGNPSRRSTAWSPPPLSPTRSARTMSPTPRSPTRRAGGRDSLTPSPTHSSYNLSFMNANRVRDEGKIEVYVRVRPFLPRELEQLETAHPDRPPRPVITVEGNSILVDDPDDKGDGKTRQHLEFEVDGVLWSCEGHPPSAMTSSFAIADQYDVYQKVGKGSLEAALDSYNATIFAYGSTGSGKTYTMLGDQGSPGIASHLMKELFQHISESSDNCVVEVTFMEIYNEMVRDLLRRNGEYLKNAKIRQHPVHGMWYVDVGKEQPLTVKKVNTFSECTKAMENGLAARSTAETKLNATSSRSHALFQIYFKKTCVETGVLKSSVINIVDLAGSERVKQSGAEGAQLAEATAINLSLTTLRRVIDVLIDNAKHNKRMLPPYRDSLLTHVLKESLGGNSRTTIIGCVSPWEGSVVDTRSTLHYAARARSVVCHAVRNEQPTEKLVEMLKKQVAELQARLRGEFNTSVASLLSGDVGLLNEAAIDSPSALKEHLETQMQVLKKMEDENRQLKQDRERAREGERKLSKQMDQVRADAHAVSELMDTIRQRDKSISDLESRLKTVAHQSSVEREDLRKDYYAEKQKRLNLQREYEVAQEKASSCTCKIVRYELRQIKEALSRELATSQALKEELQSKSVNETDQLKILNDHIASLSDDLAGARAERDLYKKQYLALQKIYDAERGIIEVMCRAPSVSIERARTRSSHVPDRTPLQVSSRSPSPARPLPPPGSPGSANHIDQARMYRTGATSPRTSPRMNPGSLSTPRR